MPGRTQVVLLPLQSPARADSATVRQRPSLSAMSLPVLTILIGASIPACGDRTPASPTDGKSDPGTVAQPADIAGNWYLTAARNSYEGDSCVAEVHRQVAALEEPHRAASNLPVVVTQSGSSITWTYPGNRCSLPGTVTGNTFALTFDDIMETCTPSAPATSGFPTPWQRFPPPWHEVCQVPWRMTAVSSPDPAFRGKVTDGVMTLTAVYEQHWESQRGERDIITWTTIQTYHRTPRG